MKLAYVIGFVEGSSQIAFYWDVLSEDDSKKPSISRVTKLMVDFTEVRYGHFKDGLDNFYKDYRNTSIHVEDAIFHIRDEIKGNKKRYLECDLARLRKQATDPAYDE